MGQRLLTMMDKSNHFGPPVVVIVAVVVVVGLVAGIDYYCYWYVIVVVGFVVGSWYYTLDIAAHVDYRPSSGFVVVAAAVAVVAHRYDGTAVAVAAAFDDVGGCEGKSSRGRGRWYGLHRKMDLGYQMDKSFG